MELVLRCPFKGCLATVSAPTKTDVPLIKNWMGKHLANYHKNETIAAIQIRAEITDTIVIDRPKKEVGYGGGYSYSNREILPLLPRRENSWKR